MTEQQKKLVAEIQKEAESLIGVGKYVERACPPGEAILKGASARITQALDALEADGKCKVVKTDFSETATDRYACSVCGNEIWGPARFCQHCGREIEATE